MEVTDDEIDALKKTKMYTNTDQINYFSQMILILKYAFHLH